MGLKKLVLSGRLPWTLVHWGNLKFDSSQSFQPPRLDRILILGHRRLEVVLTEYVEHYNAHRPHRSLDQRSPRQQQSPPTDEVDAAHLLRTHVLRGLIHEYRLAA